MLKTSLLRGKHKRKKGFASEARRMTKDLKNFCLNLDGSSLGKFKPQKALKALTMNWSRQGSALQGPWITSKTQSNSLLRHQANRQMRISRHVPHGANDT